MQDDEVDDCRRFEEASWLLISGELDDVARAAWQQHVAGCGECADLLAARRRVLDVYDGLVPAPERPLDLSRTRLPTRRQPAWLRAMPAVAASVALLAIGALAGRALSPGGGQSDALRDVQRRLNEAEVQLAVARLDQPTAAERLRAAAAGIALVRRDPRIIDSFLEALEADPSPNVRMAIIEALYTLENTTRVEERFETLLAAQPSPLLRIALVELAADRRFVQAVGALERLAAAAEDDSVRQRARWALGILSTGA
jgi:hypothetical protein